MGKLISLQNVTIPEPPWEPLLTALDRSGSHGGSTCRLYPYAVGYHRISQHYCIPNEQDRGRLSHESEVYVHPTVDTAKVRPPRYTPLCAKPVVLIGRGRTSHSSSKG
jgi:hypothetical protein